MPRVIITGANRGIGLEFVKSYLKSSFEVVALCRSSSEELKKLLADHPSLSIVSVDLTSLESIKQAAEQCGDAPVDILINNAGVYERISSSSLSPADQDNWLRSFQVNTIAPFVLAKAFEARLKAAKNPAIALLTSKMGSVSDNTSGGSYVYRSGKAALNAVGKSLALDLTDAGISVLLLHPGWVVTDMGGPHALIETTESVEGMRKIIDSAGPEQSGKFYAFDGGEVPW